MKFNLQLLGDRIIETVESYNMSLDDFLQQNNLSINLIKDIRNGVMPDFESVYKFALTTNCSMDYLLGLKSNEGAGD